MDYDFSNEKRALLALSEKLNQTLLERDALREEVSAVLRERDKARSALEELFDAHYGVSYHHCGDGDGLLPGSAAQIVELVRKIRNE